MPAILNDRSRPIIVFEINELPYRVVDDFCRFQPQSAFSRFCRNGAQLQAATTDSGKLHPKSSWPTFHRGVNNDTHGICEFNQDLSQTNQQYPPVWQILQENGYRIGVGGSIASYPVPASRDNLAFYIPDMFAPSDECIPEYVRPFHRLNLSMTAANSRVVKQGPRAKDGLAVMKGALRMGIGPRAFAKVAGQLAVERIKKHRIVRRRTLQSILGFDIVYKQIAGERPEFCTYFTNHVASSMHRYWAAAFPEDYEEYAFDRQWQELYGGEIRFAMTEADFQLNKLMRFVESHPEYLLMVVGSMGQQATQAVPVENQILWRNAQALFNKLDIATDRWEQLAGMEPVYNFKLHPDETDRFVAGIESIRIDGQSLTCTQLDPTSFAVWLGIRNVSADNMQVTLQGKPIDLAELGMVLQKIQDRTGATADHIPEGVLMILDPQRSLAQYQDRTTFTTPEVTASILAHYQVDVPSYMPNAQEPILDCLASPRLSAGQPRTGRPDLAEAVAG